MAAGNRLAMSSHPSIEQAAGPVQAEDQSISVQYVRDYPQRVSAMVLACNSAKIEDSKQQVLPSNWVETAGKKDVNLRRDKILYYATTPEEIINPFPKMISSNPPLNLAIPGQAF